MDRLKLYSKTLFISTLGGGLFYILNFPLSWLLGPITSTLVWNVIFPDRRLEFPHVFRNIGLVILGYMMGASFTRQALSEISLQLPYMAFATISTVLYSLFLAYFLSRKAKVNLPSTAMGSVPGGLSQMVVLTEEIQDADLTVVTFMQTIRLLAVVFIVPFMAVHFLGGGSANANSFASIPIPSWDWPDWSSYEWPTVNAIIGAVLGKLIHLPTSYLLGPTLTSAISQVAGHPAPRMWMPLLVLGQVFVGSQMGCSLKIQNLSNWKKLLPFSVLGAISLVFFSLLIALALNWLVGIPMVTAFLCTAPGGMTEMGLTATLVHANLSVVIGYQTFRIFFVLFVVPPILKWFLKRIRSTKEKFESSQNI